MAVDGQSGTRFATLEDVAIATSFWVESAKIDKIRLTLCTGIP